MALQPGTEAPDFELKDQTGQPVRLSDYHGKKAVVVVFHTLAFTSTCTSELCSIRDQIESFRNDEVETLTISVDAPPTHRVWAEQEGFDFPLLSDFWPHGEVARTYGVLNEVLGIAERGTFIIDKEGVIRYSQHNGIPESRDPDAYLKALADIRALS